LYPFTTRRTSLNNPACRSNFRRAALDVLKAYPNGKDATADWKASHWNNLCRNMELNEGRDLLTHMFESHWKNIEGKLDSDQRTLLVEIFMDFLPRVDPDRAVWWTEHFRKSTSNRQEALMMRVRRAEILLYYKDDPEAAKEILDLMLMSRSKDEASEWARIRYGDIEFLTGNVNKAVALYGEVQDRAGRRQADDRGNAHPPKRGSLKLKHHPPAEAWKVRALNEAAASENVKSLIEQGYMLEAKRALRAWEREFPLSKLSSDYLLVEGTFYMALRDWTRAEQMLDAYCAQVDASSYVPAAVEVLLECKRNLKLPKDEMIEFCKEMKKKLEYHPVGEKIDRVLRELE